MYNESIGKKVKKISINGSKYKQKKFKSGLYENTVKGVIMHPQLNMPAYTFIEDDSYVECRRCEVII